MKAFGIWILLMFAIYYVITLAYQVEHKYDTDDKTVAQLILGGILALGVVLTFFI